MAQALHVKAAGASAVARGGAVRPQVGAYVVALWLWGIVLNLLLVPGFYDIAPLNLGLSPGVAVPTCAQWTALSRTAPGTLWLSHSFPVGSC